MEKLPCAEKAHVKCFERGCAVGAEKKEQFFAERREKNQKASHQFAENEWSLHKLEPTIVAVNAERNEWRELSTEATEELKLVQADIALRLAI